MKIVMAPVNVSGQPITLVNAIRKKGIDISLIQYVRGDGRHRFGYESDKVINHSGLNRFSIHIDTIEKLLKDDVTIFHFWLRSLLFGENYDYFTGFDIPIIRGYGRKIIYRFTGEDLRIRSIHTAKNPHNAYKYGYSTNIDEYVQRKYLDFLCENTGWLLVQDIELWEYCPQASIVPRGVDLTRLPFGGAVQRDVPKVLHAPSNSAVKGTRFIREAVESLRDEGLRFAYEELSDQSHEAALECYKSADIIVDQLHIGWYGVLAVEGMALGKTVISYIREDLYEQHQPRVPILVANPNTIKEVLRSAIKDYDLRQEIGPKARDFASNVHDVNTVGDQLIDIYKSVNPDSFEERTSFPTLTYFALQYEMLDEKPRQLRAEVRDLQVKAKRLEQIKRELSTLRAQAARYDELKAEAKSLRRRLRYLELRRKLKI